jgi:hypothetical protein
MYIYCGIYYSVKSLAIGWDIGVRFPAGISLLVPITVVATPILLCAVVSKLFFNHAPLYQ